MTTPDSTPATVEGVMSIAFELARIREQHGAQSGVYLSEVRALRAEVERLAAQSAPTEPPQEFESAQGRALASAWAEGWTQCRDAEYAGEEAQSEAFNQSYTLAQCLHADQTRLQGGLSNDQLRRAWSAKLPRVIPTDEQLTAFALGIEVAVAQSAPLAQQAREYPPLPKLPTMTVLSELQSGTQEMVRLDVAHEAMRAYVDADRAAAHVEPPAGRVIPADGEVRPTQEQGQDAAPAEQPQDDEPTWQELEDFRKRHWTHWNAADNLLIAHLAQKLKCAARAKE